MSDPTYHCPECGSDRVFSSHEQAFMVNTGDHWCHRVKPHDPEANAGCLDCDWRGRRDQLKEPT
ncbi:hypothetical protein [Hydrogenophaga sp.]|uniref:hypothetical protein n=1 Tax=Hydrogenophaga sp. TaxID=1904254 RepID=UPI002730242A|nr:hypothetical protein [Hydrogenophaga sp.]MDP2074600.1 hypothetical protein [Hydrogenophaga sp.]MDP3106431.1 hypothetical protein [Hydrogenophaga sp.]